MNVSLDNIDLSNLDDQQSSDSNIQSRKKVIKLGAGLQAFRGESDRERSLKQGSTAALLNNDNAPDPRQTRELDADDFFSLGKYTI